MRISPEWKKIVRRAKSVRFMILASLLTGCEAVLTAFGADWIPVPQWVRMLLILLVIGLAFVFRLIAQKDYDDA